MKKLLTLFFVFTVCMLSFAQMSGTYYIGNPGTGPGGSNPDYASLNAACAAVSSAGVSGNITFYITSDLTETLNSNLGVNTAGYSITFKPYDDADKTITFTKTTDNAASSGGLVIGLSADNWANLVTTDNIIIDGYATGGSTRRLTLVTASTAHTAHTPIHIVGDVNNVTIKNCNLTVSQTTGTSTFGAVSMRSGKWGGVNYIPDNIIIDNCIINTSTPSGAGIFFSFTTSGGGATPDGRPLGLEFKNNTITVKHRAVSLNYAGTSSIHHNQISVNQPATGYASFGIGGTSSGLVLTNIYSNKITQLSTGNTGGAGNGIRGIQASGGGTWNIYNNFITGFATPATGTTEVVGIRCGSTSNIYHNTIVMNNVSTTGPGTTPTGGIVTYTTAVDIRNNIIITEEDDFVSYCIYASSLPITSNYNDLYRSGTTNANIGYYLGAQPTLNNWQTATSLDANSVSVAVTFISSTDLHLAGSSVGDPNLLGTDLTSLVSDDIDGETRLSPPTGPYMGADEGSIPLPIELSAFSASVKYDAVQLSWKTNTEVNSSLFEIQRKVENAEWTKIGEVTAAGNSNSPKDYSYVDRNLTSGKYLYRLKMIDADGSYQFSKVVEAEITLPTEFSLSQNYPNPFNPTTQINYSLPFDTEVRLDVYTSNGELVRTLVNETQSAGTHTVEFNASDLASGTYIYRMVAKDFVQTRKMILIK